MKTVILSLLLIGTAFAGPKAEHVQKLRETRQEILDKFREESDKKYVASLEKLLKQLPSDSEDNRHVQNEIYRIRFIGKYVSKNNSSFKVNILEDGIAQHVGGAQGTWVIKEIDRKAYFYVSFPNIVFIVAADQVGDYLGAIEVKGGAPISEGLLKRKD